LGFVLVDSLLLTVYGRLFNTKKIKTVHSKPSIVNQIKHPTTVTLLKKLRLFNDNDRSVSKHKVQPKTTKKQQWCSKSSSWVLVSCLL